MRVIQRLTRKISRGFIHIILVLCCLGILVPLIWVVRTSFVYRIEAYQIPPKWIFTPTTDNYLTIFSTHPFHLYLVNSLSIALATTLISLAIGSLAAYSFARFHIGGLWFNVGILTTQMLPPITLIIPFFLMARIANLINTRSILIIAYLTFNLPFVIWIMASFFQGIPRELEESAMMDGCSRAQAFLRIIIPLSLPGLLSAGLFSFVLSWNEFLFALILTGKYSRTLPVGIAALVTQRGILIGPVCAGIILVMLPMILLYFFTKTFLIHGLTLGAIK